MCQPVELSNGWIAVPTAAHSLALIEKVDDEYTRKHSLAIPMAGEMAGEMAGGHIMAEIMPLKNTRFMVLVMDLFKMSEDDEEGMSLFFVDPSSSSLHVEEIKDAEPTCSTLSSNVSQEQLRTKGLLQEYRAEKYRLFSPPDGLNAKKAHRVSKLQQKGFPGNQEASLILKDEGYITVNADTTNLKSLSPYYSNECHMRPNIMVSFLCV